jgi:peptidoglycan/xylan/chitin deacetylase (PgdA/CDA1 family)
MRKQLPSLGLVAIFALAIAGCPVVRRDAQRLELEATQWVQQGAGEIVWRVTTDQKVVALTFDDGPDPKYTPTVLKLAHDKGIKLTFFLIGKEIQLHPDLARQEVAAGHAVGNHTWDHAVLTRDTPREVTSEIERCGDEIEEICGKRTHLFRPPKGYWDGDTFIEAERLGYRIILWSVALEHHTAKTPEAMAQRVLRKIRPGMIILAHDGEPGHPIDHSQSMKALPILVDGLLKRGYRFVTVPQLLILDKGKG